MTAVERRGCQSIFNDASYEPVAEDRIVEAHLTQGIGRRPYVGVQPRIFRVQYRNR